MSSVISLVIIGMLVVGLLEAIAGTKNAKGTPHSKGTSGGKTGAKPRIAIPTSGTLEDIDQACINATVSLHKLSDHAYLEVEYSLSCSPQSGTCRVSLLYKFASKEALDQLLRRVTLGGGLKRDGETTMFFRTENAIVRAGADDAAGRFIHSFTLSMQACFPKTCDVSEGTPYTTAGGENHCNAYYELY